MRMGKNIGGQSVVEIVVALAIFLIIAGSSMVTILGALSISKLGEEEAQATMVAVEGLEAVASIKNQSWEILSEGTYGLTNTNGYWEFNGESDVDVSNKFTRSITISSVQRDGNGDIVGEGGTVDADTYAVTSTVNWDFSVSRQKEIEISTYLTNWFKAVNLQSP